MNPRLKELLERKKTFAAEIRRQADMMAGGAITPEQQAGWDAVNKDFDENEAAITRLQRADKVAGGVITEAKPEPRLAPTSSVANEETRTAAIAGWFCEQQGLEPTDVQLDAMQTCGLMNPRGRVVSELALGLLSTSQYASAQRQYRNSSPAQREMLLQGIGAVGLTTSTGDTPAAGRIIAPGQLVTSLEMNMLAFGGVRQVAETIRTANGEPLKWPSGDDTANTGEQLGEASSIGSSTDPLFTVQTWTAYKFSSKLIKFTAELLQDSMFDLPAILGAMLGERLGRVTNTKYTTANGSSTPEGIVYGSSLGVTAASATAIAFDELIDLIHSIDPAYRTSGCGFMMHDSTIKALRKLKDGDGRYIWQDGSNNAAAGFVQTLLGWPTTANQDMATVATGVKSVIFGKLFNFKIRTVGEVRVRRLQELYAATDEEGMIAFIREDGKLLKPGTATVKHLIQA